MIIPCKYWTCMSRIVSVVQWKLRRSGSWLAGQLGAVLVEFGEADSSEAIETAARRTNELGSQKLWNGYPSSICRERATLTADEVRIPRHLGSFFAWIVKQRRPEIIVEIGTAFGVSGMYWLAGLEDNNAGELLAFEPNAECASIGERNLSEIGSRYRLTVDTFENSIDAVLEGRRIDIAFVDAIHTPEFLIPQVEIVRERCAPGALILLDDIDFHAGMRQCWRDFASGKWIVASAAVDGRVGILELPP